MWKTKEQMTKTEIIYLKLGRISISKTEKGKIFYKVF